jgi:hypothetical protein
LHAQEADDKKNLEREKAAKVFDRGKKWAIVIGVNDYLDPGIPKLNYCVADARILADQLTKSCGYDPDRLLLITDDQSKKHLLPLARNLRDQTRDWLKQTSAGDTVLVYFSGHGFLDAKSQGSRGRKHTHSCSQSKTRSHLFIHGPISRCTDCLHCS